MVSFQRLGAVEMKSFRISQPQGTLETPEPVPVEGLDATFLYLGPTDEEAQQVASDPGRGGLVILEPWWIADLW